MTIQQLIDTMQGYAETHGPDIEVHLKTEPGESIDSQIAFTIMDDMEDLGVFKETPALLLVKGDPVA